MNKSILRQEGDIKPRDHPRNIARQELNNDLDADGEEGFSQYNSSNGGAFNLVTNNIKNQYNKEHQMKRQTEQIKSTPALLQKVEDPHKIPEYESNVANGNLNSPQPKSISVIK